jgi:DNA-binding MarR family transcriptional regulator
MVDTHHQFKDIEPKEEVVLLLREMLHALLRSSIHAWVDLQLSLPQLRTVFIVAHSQTCSIAQVAQQLGVGEPTASHLVDKLVKANLLKREEDPDDRRKVRVELSPEGDQMVAKLLGWEDLLSSWLERVPGEDLAQFRHGLTAVMQAAGSLESEKS